MVTSVTTMTATIPLSRRAQHNIIPQSEGMCAYLVKQSDIEREAESVPQVDFIRQCTTELLGCGGRVRQQCFGCAVHERHRQHDRLLRLGGLDVNFRALVSWFSKAGCQINCFWAPNGF